MDKKPDFAYVPNAVVEHYHKLLSGYKYERDGVVTVVKEWSRDDEKTMLRLLTDHEMIKDSKNVSWFRITSLLLKNLGL